MTRDLSCPFCRKDTAQPHFADHGTFIFAHVECTTCQARGPTVTGNTFSGVTSYAIVTSSAILDWLRIQLKDE